MSDENFTAEDAQDVALRARDEARNLDGEYQPNAQDTLREAADTIEALLDNPRDSSHTMDELYHYRMLYNALAFNALVETGTPIYKSWRHHDGELCFGGGWFIVVASLPTGQVSNHYREEHWDLFQVLEVELPPPYDGHTPAIAADRLMRFLQS